MDLIDWARDALHTLNVWHHEVITILKVPTPIKILKVVTTLPDGCIGSGLDDMSYPETLWECPMSHEAWIHRILVTSPNYGPANALSAGEILLLASNGAFISWTPQPGMENNVIPAIIEQEGRFSAAHLSAGEKLYVLGDQLPAGINIRFDLQINLVAGVSPDTPIPYIGTTVTSPSTSNGS